MSTKAVHLDNLMFLYEVSTPKQLSDYTFARNHPTLTPLGERHMSLLVAVHRKGYYAVFSTASPYTYFGSILSQLRGGAKPLTTSVVMEHFRATDREDWTFYSSVHVIDKDAMAAILEMTGLIEVREYLAGLRMETEGHSSLHSYYRVMHKETQFVRWTRMPTGTPSSSVIAQVKRVFADMRGARTLSGVALITRMKKVWADASDGDFEILEEPSHLHKFVTNSDDKRETTQLNDHEEIIYQRAQEDDDTNSTPS